MQWHTILTNLQLWFIHVLTLILLSLLWIINIHGLYGPPFVAGLCHILWYGDLQHSDVRESIEGNGQTVRGTRSAVVPCLSTKRRRTASESESCLQVGHAGAVCSFLAKLYSPDVRDMSLQSSGIRQWNCEVRCPSCKNHFCEKPQWKLHLIIYCNAPCRNFFLAHEVVEIVGYKVWGLSQKTLCWFTSFVLKTDLWK